MINKENEQIINKICRGCMCQNVEMRNVFDTKEMNTGETLQLADMLTACTSINISTEDGLPNSLCIDCENKLCVSYEFKKCCQKTDAKLREIARSPNAAKSIKIELSDIEIQPDLGTISDILQSDYESDSEDDGDDSKKLFKCGYCKKTLRTKKGLRIHQRVHISEKLLECNVCRASFTRTQLLVKHLKTHNENETEATGDNASESGKKDDEIGPKDPNTKMWSDEEPDDTSDKEWKECMELDEDKTKISEKDKYKCKFCEKILTTYMGFQIHMRRHTGNLISCNLCDKEFAKSNHLKRHMQTHGLRATSEKNKSLEKKVMICEFCDRKFKYKKSYNHHMQNEHGMSDDSDVPASTKNTNPEQAVPGETNNLPMKSNDDEMDETSYITDDLQISTKPHVCHVCEARFTRANHLTRHMTLHRTLLVHKCDQCDKAFASEDFLKKHLTEEHVNKPYACTVCNKPFNRGEHLIRHLRVHQAEFSGEEDLKCSVCEKVFTSSDNLAHHIKMHLIQDKRHVCRDCGRAFNRLDNLKAHQRVHSGVKDTTKMHLCVYCGKEFNNSSNMIVHMRRHTGERPYKCTQCGKGFPRSHDLKCHERTHSGEKPYQCSLCGKSFNKSNKLLRHTRVHTGERPYVCNICSRAFTQSNDLVLHMRRHTGARPYACGVCAARFIQSGQLKAHRRSTGHWMETQPDLKGAHRVEPVTALVEPKPIRFKTHGKPKQETTPIENSTEFVVDPTTKIIEIQSGELIENNAFNVNDIKFKAELQNLGDVKCELAKTVNATTTETTSQQPNSGLVDETLNFHGENVTFTEIPVTSTTFTTTTVYTFQNYE